MNWFLIFNKKLIIALLIVKRAENWIISELINENWWVEEVVH
jgi:hypothetical protein